MCLRIMLKPADFEPLNIEQHRFVRWRRQQSIGPPTLVKRSPVENRLTVERHAKVTVSSRALPTERIPAYEST